MSRCLRLAMFLSVAPLASRLLAQAPPFGGEFQVNTYTTGDQDFPVVAVAPDGQFIIAWQSQSQDGSAHGVFAQLYDATGGKSGSEIAVNAYTTGDQFVVNAAAGNDGNFVVTWQSKEYTPSYGVFARKFLHGNNDGPGFLVSAYTTGGAYTSAVAIGADSSFVVVWADHYPADHVGIFGQRFGPTLGSAVGSEIQVAAGSLPVSPAIAMDDSGEFVVVWEDNPGVGGYGIFGQRFDATGAKVGSVFPVNSHTTGDQRSAQVTMGKHGDFVVVWSDYSGEDGDYAGVFGQRFDASGEKVGSEFQVNTYTTGFQGDASVAMDTRGGFVVIWYNGYDPRCRHRRPEVRPYGSEGRFRVRRQHEHDRNRLPQPARLVRRIRCLRRNLGSQRGGRGRARRRSKSHRSPAGTHAGRRAHLLRARRPT